MTSPKARPGTGSATAPRPAVGNRSRAALIGDDEAMSEAMSNEVGDTGVDPSGVDPSGVVERIRRSRAGFSPTEAAIAETVLADPQAALMATTGSLAEGAGVSQASVVRFCRALGYTGLPDLRLALAQELSRRDLEHERSGVAHGRIDASDSLADLAAKIAFHEARSIEQTARQLDLDALEETARAIAVPRPVTVFGVGASGLVAADLTQKLQRIGQPCQFHADTHVQLVHAALLDADDVAVGFSFSGRTRDVGDCLRLAREGGALTVAVTGDPRSPTARGAARVLLTAAREDELRAAALASRMAQLAVVDILFARVAQLRFDDLDAALATTRAAVDRLRLRP
ncbi:MurR/RpiR family transcriptional regulator [Actinomyces sp. HMT897]|uniref:MurR/RpiR family transcriptional regulator n=1 Tax=Actinomyces sp. HMT897 TaxID=2789424 RepID=UPI00190D5F80|nr:MurR/RpiR family transcriptional regulator [Actinomyces sp. HMT897]QQO78873.1 MurR/RpiR family transcriptional regulator [Actinomyces sp. HMT897]